MAAMNTPHPGQHSSMSFPTCSVVAGALVCCVDAM